MNEFLGLVKKTSNRIDKLKPTLEEMETLTRKVSGASNDKETKKLRDSLALHREDFISDMSQIKKEIHILKKKSEEGCTELEKHTRHQHMKSLIDRTKKMVEEFSTAQSEFGSEERERLKSQYIIAHPTATKEEIEQIEYSSSPKIPFMNKSTTKDSEDRKQSLQHIAQGITQVTQMTDELNLLVHKPERTIDKISVTATATETKAKKADKDLKKALKYQRLARWAKMLAIGIISLIAIAIIVVVFGGILFMIIMLALNIRNRASEDSSDTTGNTTGNTTAPGTLNAFIPPELASFFNSNPPATGTDTGTTGDTAGTTGNTGTTAGTGGTS
ncbi:syntaxin 1A [Nematocida sp. AWRm80]|nr:syntaxin 1A [Nematocida sp. AWRm80]